MSAKTGERQMKAVKDYLRHAAECERLAHRAMSDEQREMILHMAATWRNLAETRRTIILRQQETHAQGS